MPEMTLEWTLKENGIDPKKDVTIDTAIAFSAMQGAFIGGTGDFVTLFEQNVKIRKLIIKKLTNITFNIIFYLTFFFTTTSIKYIIITKKRI